MTVDPDTVQGGEILRLNTHVFDEPKATLCAPAIPPIIGIHALSRA